MRECGDCTACCEGWLPDESLDMYAGQPCKHRIQGGCSIYSDRPENPCKTFRCAWLDEEATFPEEMRPDLCGAIVLKARYWREWNVMRATPVGTQIPSETLEWLRVHTQKLDVPLIFYERLQEEGAYTGAMQQRAYGSHDFAAAIKEVVMRVGFAEETLITPNDVVRF